MDAASSPSPGQPGNRLQNEKSPYLLQHAHNPVHWYPWGEEAFAKARSEDKPIFLSIGYSTCHWCHVMAHESFENAAMAALMNELFVNVKLDREERPDVDRVYMTFVQATSGSGGWPMSVWLQPDLKPILGGTYFPPDDRYGRRGFASICRAVAHAWHEERDKVLAQGERIVSALRDYASQEQAPAVPGTPGSIKEILRAAGGALAAGFDLEWGGFGNAPKFPRPVTLALLARVQARLTGEDAAQAQEIMHLTLDRMAAGGMYDQLGGGFHRYSVDRYWHVPHFEKMLYDQAQLTVAYLEGFQISGEQRYAYVARDILAYVQRDLRSPEGGFYCAEDADSLLAHGRPEHAEGAFYVWTQSEIEAALSPDDAAAFCRQYRVLPNGNAPAESDPHGEFTGKNILMRDQPDAPVDAALDQARRTLFDLRSRRPRPHLDDKIVTSWNGLMISAFARASQVLDDPAYLQTANRAVEFIRRHLYNGKDGTLRRAYRQGPGAVDGFADDYAFLIQGLLDLYEAGFDFAHLHWAEELQLKQDELFYDAGNGGYFGSGAHDANVLLRLKETHDGAEPSASSVAALNLCRLATMTDREEWKTRAELTAAAFGAVQNPARTAQTMPLLLCAVDALAGPLKQIVVAGQAGAEDTRRLLRAIHSLYLPNKALLLADGGHGQRELAHRLPFLAEVGPQNGQATAYLCADGACQLPTTNPTALTELLGNAR